MTDEYARGLRSFQFETNSGPVTLGWHYGDISCELEQYGGGQYLKLVFYFEFPHDYPELGVRHSAASKRFLVWRTVNGNAFSVPNSLG